MRDDDGDQISEEDVVIRAQPETAVYENPQGAVVIRQESYIAGEDDPFVFIRKENLPALIEALWRYLSEFQQASLKRSLPLGGGDGT